MSDSSARWDPAIRDSLRQRVTRVLAEDPWVDHVELNGSLASGRADIYSDIDVFAYLRPGFNDRDFFLQLPQVMDRVGPRIIDGLSFAALPHYAGMFYFERMPLLWHVDIGCLPATEEWHVDGADLFALKRWEQRFKMWIEAVKRFLRAESQPAAPELRLAFEEYLADMKSRVTKRMDLSSVVGESRKQLSSLLDMEIAWHRAAGIGDEQVFEACDGLRAAVLVPRARRLP